MALVIQLEFFDEDESFQYRDDPHLVAVYKRPTLFCERKPECLINNDSGKKTVYCVTSSRGWSICRVCGRYALAAWQSEFYKRTPWFGTNLIDKFKQSQIGDKI